MPLDPTGVVPGNYGGAVVNVAGQFTYIPPAWPASALPVFPLDGGGSGGTPVTQAAAISYQPGVGSQYALATNVQTALTQVDAALVSVRNDALNSGVMVLTVGSGLTLGGTGTNPEVSLTATGITAGTYAGFAVNLRGQIVSYVAPTAIMPVIVAGTGVTVAQAPANTWTITAASASFAAAGAVRLVDPATTLTNAVPPASGGFALTWDGLKNYFTGNNVVLGGAGIAVLGPTRTVTLDIGGLPVAAALSEAGVMAVFDPATAILAKVTLAALRRAMRGDVCTGLWNVSTASLTAGFNVASTSGTAGSVVFNMTTGLNSPSYGVTVEAVGGKLVDVYYTVLSASSFWVQWTTTGSSATAVSFNVYAIT